MRILCALVFALMPSMVSAGSPENVDAMNLCMYHLGLRFYGERADKMRELVLSSCSEQIDKVGEDDNHLGRDSSVVKFFVGDFMGMYELALMRRK